MGNGYPVAAVITRKDIVERFAFAGEVFSTFGGNPVAAQAALAVLDVIEDERLVAHSARVGANLLESCAGSPSTSAVAACSWASSWRARRRPAGWSTASATPGPDRPHRAARDVLKIRPPLVFADEHVTCS
jgi:4-aminobutyrate aminotransferase-like enzyme